VAKYGKLSAYSCGAAAEFGQDARHRIPFLLLIFEETVIFAPLKDAAGSLVNGYAKVSRIGLAAPQG